jgi:hypothetical protein
MVAQVGFKIQSRGNLVDAQGTLYRTAHNRIDGPLILKLNLGLCRMHIDIDAVSRDGQKQHIGGMVFSGNESLKGLDDRSMEVSTSDWALVDIEVLIAPGFAGMFGAEDKSFGRDHIGMLFHGNQALIGFFAHNVRHPLAGIPSFEHPDILAVVLECKAQGWMGQSDGRKGFRDVPKFNRIILQKLPAGGYVKEEVFGRDARSYNPCALFGLTELTALTT